MDAPSLACAVTQSRSGASWEPPGLVTAGTTTTSGRGAWPVVVSANVYVGTMSGPPWVWAGPRVAATVYTVNFGELAKTSYGARASLPTVPVAPRATATTNPF